MYIYNKTQNIYCTHIYITQTTYCDHVHSPTHCLLSFPVLSCWTPFPVSALSDYTTEENDTPFYTTAKRQELQRKGWGPWVTPPSNYGRLWGPCWGTSTAARYSHSQDCCTWNFHVSWHCITLCRSFSLSASAFAWFPGHYQESYLNRS